MRAELSRFFDPGSIAIVGASARPDHISGRPLKYLQDKKFPGEIYPINPRYDQIAGLRCYPSLDDVPDTPDVALILVRAALVPGVVSTCARREVPFATVFAAGFAEAGPDGEALTAEIEAVLRPAKTRLIGPNCYGSLNVLKAVPLGFATPFELPEYPRGPIGLFSHSGAFAFGFLTMAMEAGLGFTYVLNSGNSMDVGLCDMMEFLADDPDTRVVAAYVEGVRDGRRFARAANACRAAGKEVVVLKVGRTESAARAAHSHTASLSGSTVAFEAAASRLGVVLVHDPDEFVDVLKGLGGSATEAPAAPLPKGVSLGGARPGVAVITTSGASGILFVEAADRLGLRLPELEGDDLVRVKDVLPPFVAPSNPIDTTAMILDRPALIPNLLHALHDSTRFQAAVVMVSTPTGEFGEALAGTIQEAAALFGRPVFVVVTSGERYTESFHDLIRASGIPLFQSPHRAARALAAFLDSRAGGGSSDPADWEPILGGAPERELGSRSSGQEASGSMGEVAAKHILSAAGIPTPKGRIVRSAGETRAALEELEPPLVAKTTLPDVIHKAVLGLIVLDIVDEPGAERARAAIVSRSKALDLVPVDGAVLLEEQRSGGIELFLGARIDPIFGVLVGVGLGGALVEALATVRWEVAPLDRLRALRMIERISGLTDLAVEGAGPDLGALADAIVAFASMVQGFGSRFESAEINPLLVLSEGKGVCALDATLVLTDP